MIQKLLASAACAALISFSFVSVSAATSEHVVADHIRVRFVLPEHSSSTEETLVGLLFEPDPHWHVYWKNPGDSGAAPKFNFVSSTADVGPVQWPAPARLPFAHLTNLGYDGSVIYLFSIRPKDSIVVSVAADLEWLVCQEECVPGFAKLSFERPRLSGSAKWSTADENLIRKFAARVPVSSGSAPIKIESIEISSSTLVLKASQSASLATESLEIFPVNGDFVLPSRPAF